MRIAVIAGPHVPIPPRQYGGIEQVIYYLLKGLKEAGHEPILIGTGDSQVDCELIAITDKAIGFPITSAELPSFQRKVRRYEDAVRKRLKTMLSKIDVIHSHGFDIKPFQAFPHVVTLHNKVNLEDLPYLAARQNLNYVSISKNQQMVFPDLNYAGVIYNGEDPLEFPLVTQPEPYVCFLGRFDSDKSPHLAIELAISKGIKIKLGGKIDHDSEHYFGEKIAPYLNHPLVEYLGELGFAEKVSLLSNARCNLHPTNFREPFGLTVIEAAYCGTPTIAIKRGAMSELIEQGRTGMLVEDFVEAYHVIDNCYSMDRQYIASRARSMFNYQTMTKQYIDAYEYVISYSEAVNASRQSKIPRPKSLLNPPSMRYPVPQVHTS